MANHMVTITYIKYQKKNMVTITIGYTFTLKTSNVNYPLHVPLGF